MARTVLQPMGAQNFWCVWPRQAAGHELGKVRCSLDTDQTVIHAWYAGVLDTGPPVMPTNLNHDKLDS